MWDKFSVNQSKEWKISPRKKRTVFCCCCCCISLYLRITMRGKTESVCATSPSMVNKKRHDTDYGTLTVSYIQAKMWLGFFFSFWRTFFLLSFFSGPQTRVNNNFKCVCNNQIKERKVKSNRPQPKWTNTKSKNNPIGSVWFFFWFKCIALLIISFLFFFCFIIINLSNKYYLFMVLNLCVMNKTGVYN